MLSLANLPDESFASSAVLLGSQGQQETQPGPDVAATWVQVLAACASDGSCPGIRSEVGFGSRVLLPFVILLKLLP